VIISRSPDVGVEDRLVLRGFRHGHLVEPLFEDRFDRRVIAGLDLQRTQCGGLKTLGPKALGEANDAQAGAVALL
jgi:hypothetical protein